MYKLKSLPSTRKLRSCRYIKEDPNEETPETSKEVVKRLATLMKISDQSDYEVV